MRYSTIRKMDVSNGEGLGISLFVQGCHFHCKGCFNQETWDFDGGKEWTETVEEKFISLASPSYIKRISILGGEPMADENIESIKKLIEKIKIRFPEKKIWIYSGYKWETLVMYNRHSYISKADILVDGQFEIDKQDLYNQYIVFAGSTNQRIIDIQRSLKENKMVLYLN